MTRKIGLHLQEMGDSGVIVTKVRRWGFDGDRYLAKCKGFFQCLNSECPYIIQYSALQHSAVYICR